MSMLKLPATLAYSSEAETPREDRDLFEARLAHLVRLVADPNTPFLIRNAVEALAWAYRSLRIAPAQERMLFSMRSAALIALIEEVARTADTLDGAYRIYQRTLDQMNARALQAWQEVPS